MPEETLILPPSHCGHIWYHKNSVPMPNAHHHAELEMNLVREGTATYLLGDRRYELHRGMMTWLFPAQEHILLDKSPGYEMWIGVFSPELVRRVCASPGTAILTQSDPPGRFCRILSPSEADWLHQLFECATRSEQDSALYDAALGHALLSAWAAWEASEDVPAGFFVHPAVEQVARLMRDEAEAISLETMAARVGLSAPRLSLLFKQQTGIPLAQFRNRQRLDRFLRAYGSGKKTTLLEAALEAGWGSYAQFHRVFTQMMGCSPAQYRRKMDK